MNTDIKLCPFCGEKVQVEREYNLFCCNKLGCPGTGKWVKPNLWNDAWAHKQISHLSSVNEKLVEALKIAKADVLHFKETSKMFLYPTLEAIDKALALAEASAERGEK